MANWIKCSREIEIMPVGMRTVSGKLYPADEVQKMIKKFCSISNMLYIEADYSTAYYDNRSINLHNVIAICENVRVDDGYVKATIVLVDPTYEEVILGELKDKVKFVPKIIGELTEQNICYNLSLIKLYCESSIES